MQSKKWENRISRELIFAVLPSFGQNFFHYSMNFWNEKKQKLAPLKNNALVKEINKEAHLYHLFLIIGTKEWDGNVHHAWSARIPTCNSCLPILVQLLGYLSTLLFCLCQTWRRIHYKTTDRFGNLIKKFTIFPYQKSLKVKRSEQDCLEL